jgi:hypothetical protein
MKSNGMIHYALGQFADHASEDQPVDGVQKVPSGLSNLNPWI